MSHDLFKLFKRDLEKCINELEAYPSEATLWALAGEIKNPAGNLVLHILGTLNHFIGLKLGGIDYQRNREAEFNATHIPRAEIVQQVRDTVIMLERVLPKLDTATLEATYPLEVLGYPMTTGYFLMHLYGHLNWHLGQLNYHRRLVAPLAV